MAAFSLSKRIHAPVETVFAAATDVVNYPKLIPAITKVEKLTEGPVGVGTRIRETRVVFKREATEVMEFTSFDPNRSYTLSCQSCGVLHQSTFRFRPEGGDTILDFDFTLRAQTFFAKLMSPLGRLMMGMMKKCVASDLDHLQKSIEAACPVA